MKTISFLILIVCFSSLGSYAQYTEVFSAYENADTTFLIYRKSEYNVYKFNLNTWQETIFYTEGRLISGSYSDGLFTTDIEFDNKETKNCYSVEYTYFTPKGGLRANSYIRKNGNRIYTILYINLPSSGEKQNIEISEQNADLIYVSSSKNFTEFDVSSSTKLNYLLKSTDGGLTWNYFQTAFTLLSVNKNDDKKLIGISNNRLVLASSENLLSFVVVDSVYKWNNILTKFYYSSDRKHIFTTAIKDSLNCLVISTDNGQSWKSILQSPYPINIALDKTKPEDVYYSVDKNIYYSSDFGSNSSLFQTLPERIEFLYKKENSGFLYAITPKYRFSVANSGFELLLSSTLDVKEDVTPGNFTLSQNYPNPFNPETKINYRVNKESFVTLKVYDICGTEVQTLINQKIQPGSYSVPFSGKNLSTGIYFYRLKVDGSEITRKMCLIK